MKNNFQQILA